MTKQLLRELFLQWQQKPHPVAIAGFLWAGRAGEGAAGLGLLSRRTRRNPLLGSPYKAP